MQANLAMGGNKVTGMGDGSSTNDAVNYGQVFFGAGWTPEETVASASTCDILGAASNFVEITGTTTVASLGTGTSKFRVVRFAASLTLTHNATTLICPGGANIITQAGDTMIVESDESSNARIVTYMSAANATTFGVAPITVASAGTCNILGANSPLVSISGTTTITSFGTGPNRVRFVNFTGALLLTHNATSLILPGGRNIQTQNGDTCVVVSDASSNARVIAYQPITPVAVSIPTGRLTLTSAVPVLVSDVTAATSIYYTPYLGNTVPIYDGVVYRQTAFSELTLALNSSAQLANTNYDLFLADDSGTLRLVTGPAWTAGGGSDTARGTGAGSTQLSYNNGLLANTVSMTAKYGSSSFTVAAGYGLYIGTMRASANGQCEMTFRPNAASGGTNNKLFLWNMYNRSLVAAACRDSTDSWAYSTATWRAANGAAANVNNRISLVQGLNVEAAAVSYSVYFNGNVNFQAAGPGIGLDSTGAIAAGSSPGIMGIIGPSGGTVSASMTGVARYAGFTGLGLHFYQALEIGNNGSGNTNTWYGDNGDAGAYQMVLSLTTSM